MLVLALSRSLISVLTRCSRSTLRLRASTRVLFAPLGGGSHTLPLSPHSPLGPLAPLSIAPIISTGVPASSLAVSGFTLSHTTILERTTSSLLPPT